ncbi:hypothetical protein KY330_00215 [Candidatus Woesearchaeota archaeon]|nr:hypothetical protein [Candidatus Woesearchaeota archaeon]
MNNLEKYVEKIYVDDDCDFCALALNDFDEEQWKKTWPREYTPAKLKDKHFRAMPVDWRGYNSCWETVRFDGEDLPLEVIGHKVSFELDFEQREKREGNVLHNDTYGGVKVTDLNTGKEYFGEKCLDQTEMLEYLLEEEVKGKLKAVKVPNNIWDKDDRLKTDEHLRAVLTITTEKGDRKVEFDLEEWNTEEYPYWFKKEDFLKSQIGKDVEYKAAVFNHWFRGGYEGIVSEHDLKIGDKTILSWRNASDDPKYRKHFKGHYRD